MQGPTHVLRGFLLKFTDRQDAVQRKIPQCPDASGPVIYCRLFREASNFTMVNDPNINMSAVSDS